MYLPPIVDAWHRMKERLDERRSRWFIILSRVQRTNCFRKPSHFRPATQEFAVFAQVSVGKMLIAGILPGLLTVVVYIAMVVLRCWRQAQKFPK